MIVSNFLFLFFYFIVDEGQGISPNNQASPVNILN